LLTVVLGVRKFAANTGLIGIYEHPVSFFPGLLHE
jgi:hypothetical protein